MAFPYFPDAGGLAYFKCRAASGDKDTCFEFRRAKNSRLYNLPALNDLRDDEPPTIVEGERDVAALHKKRWRGAVSVPDGAGSSITEALIAPLQRFTSITLALDDDPAGWALAQRLSQRLASKQIKHITWSAAHE